MGMVALVVMRMWVIVISARMIHRPTATILDVLVSYSHIVFVAFALGDVLGRAQYSLSQQDSASCQQQMHDSSIDQDTDRALPFTHLLSRGHLSIVF